MSDIAEEIHAIEQNPGDQPYTAARFRTDIDTLRAASTPFQETRTRALGLGDAKEAPMSEQRLSEIEVREDVGCDGHVKASGDLLYCPCLEAHGCDTRELLAEVRRLKRENHLLNLSRGVPSVTQERRDEMSPRERAARSIHCDACAEWIRQPGTSSSFTCPNGHSLTRALRYRGVPNGAGGD